MRFFVSKTCPNRRRLSGHARRGQQLPLDEFERAEQVGVDAPHVFVGEHLVECPPCALVSVDAEFDSAAQAVEWLRDHGHARAALAGISAVCNSQKRTAYGYSWRFADR